MITLGKHIMFIMPQCRTPPATGSASANDTALTVRLLDDPHLLGRNLWPGIGSLTVSEYPLHSDCQRQPRPRGP